MQTNELLFFMIFFELFEYFWQKGNDIKSYFITLYKTYIKGVVVFSIFHPSFIFMLFCIFCLGYENIIFYFIALFKAFDICFKIFILHKLQNKQSLGQFSYIFTENFSISNNAKLIPLVFYVSLFYVGLSF